ncbi:MAG TPA: DUF507 family protein [Geobacterales bacterium]|jgi:hypothetical protein|nr:DUF507 family protein [Geobacterales bacterium]
MRLKENQIRRLAEKVIQDLMDKGHLTLLRERGAVVASAEHAIQADQKQEEVLEREAVKLLDQAMAATPDSSAIDRPKMLRMIKEKLARERKIVL